MTSKPPFQRLREQFPRGPLLTVVVVSYEMARELPRTLYSLSTHYQRDIGAADYDVVVADNGSREPPLEADLGQYGANFRLFKVEAPTASPGPALNAGVASASSPFIAIMLDGAYILSPRVLATSLDALAAYPDAVVSLPRYYLGPGQQGSTIPLGYSKEVEDQVLEIAGWRKNGYQLFSYSAIIGHDRNTSALSTPFEGSFLVLPSELYARIGGFDVRFDQPGGGFGNMDLFERIMSCGPLRCVCVLGEGIFHQLHGGTTTNVSFAMQEEKIRSYRQHYRAIRGRDWRLPHFERSFYGTIVNQAAVARRRTGINNDTQLGIQRMIEGYDERRQLIA